MKKTVFSIIALLLAGIITAMTASGCSPIPGTESSAETLVFLNADRKAPTGTVAPTDEFKRALADFTCTLLREMAKESTDSRLVSGLSVATALGMTAGGAKGETLAQMEALLGLPCEDFAAQLGGFYASLPSTQGASFKKANAVFHTTSGRYTVEQSFIDFVNRYYDADVGLMNFGAPDAEKKVNEWCDKQTDGMIPVLFEDENALTDDTVMLLLNALCFDALWAVPYDEYSTREGTFHGVKGDEQVTMLHGEEGYYLAGEHEIGFVKPYDGGNYAFVALLPNAEGDLTDYLATLTGERLLSLWAGKSYDTVYTTMPKFTVDDSVTLNDILQSLGMTDAFDPNAADLSGLGHSEAGNTWIDFVLHKTHLELDESGTRAAAVTAVAVMDECAPMEPKTVTLDRPFVYGIVDTATGLPLFFGCCRSVG